MRPKTRFLGEKKKKNIFCFEFFELCYSVSREILSFIFLRCHRQYIFLGNAHIKLELPICSFKSLKLYSNQFVKKYTSRKRLREYIEMLRFIYLLLFVSLLRTSSFRRDTVTHKV